jgi:hypothetical protein
MNYTQDSRHITRTQQNQNHCRLQLSKPLYGSVNRQPRSNPDLGISG